MGRANQPVQPRGLRRARPYEPAAPAEEAPPAGPPQWTRCANPQAVADPAPAPQEDYEQDYPSAVHPLHRYAAQHAAPEPEYQPAPSFAEPDYEPDPSRYDDALYGRLDSGVQDAQHDPAYASDPYGYQDDGYDDIAEEPVRKRRGGMVTVAMVLALAVVGTGAAFAYRTYLGSPRSGEPPIIKADNSPTKVVPAPSDGSAKVPDRMATADGTEKLVPREEAPVDVKPVRSARGVPAAESELQPAAGRQRHPERSAAGRRRQRHAAEQRAAQDQDARGPRRSGRRGRGAGQRPAAGQAGCRPQGRRDLRSRPAGRARPTQSAVQPMPAPTRRCPWRRRALPAPATRDPGRRHQSRASSAQAAPGAGGGYMVQVASQKNEADAQASYRALQGKYSSVLGSRSPVIKRADLGDKGVYYRAMVGPFGSAG